MSYVKRWKTTFAIWWRPVLAILIPLALLPLILLYDAKESRCGYVVLWMAFYFMFEPIPLAVTALLPVAAFPALGILSTAEACTPYMKDTIMMYVGSLTLAVAVEHCNLHKRIALKVLLIIGTGARWLMLGFMTTTMFLSMWISNTATTAMMVPIVEAVMAELKSTVIKPDDDDSGPALNLDSLHKTLLMSIAYAANCGGTGTLPGTSPNMIFKGFLEEHYPESSEITYATWMAYNGPGMLMCVLVGWLVLQLIYVPCWRKQCKDTRERIRKVIAKRHRELGAITFHESAVLCLFVVLVFLWIFREPKFMRGWAQLFPKDTRIGDAVPAIGILFLLFLFPADPWRIQDSPPLLQWSVVQKKLPWGLVILLGGGLALANGTQKSGLSRWMGAQMVQLSFLSPVTVLFLLCVFTAALTEIVSNSTVTTILLPVISQMALAFEVNPLYLMLPVTIVSSYAFMLPVATGPNAIVFDTGIMKTVDMVKPGIIMNIVCCCIQMALISTLGASMFHLNTFPTWANSTLAKGNWTSSFNSSGEVN